MAIRLSPQGLLKRSDPNSLRALALTGKSGVDTKILQQQFNLDNIQEAAILKSEIRATERRLIKDGGTRFRDFIKKNRLSQKKRSGSISVKKPSLAEQAAQRRARERRVLAETKREVLSKPEEKKKQPKSKFTAKDAPTPLGGTVKKRKPDEEPPKGTTLGQKARFFEQRAKQTGSKEDFIKANSFALASGAKGVVDFILNPEESIKGIFILATSREAQKSLATDIRTNPVSNTLEFIGGGASVGVIGKIGRRAAQIARTTSTKVRVKNIDSNVKKNLDKLGKDLSKAQTNKIVKDIQKLEAQKAALNALGVQLSEKLIDISRELGKVNAKTKAGAKKADNLVKDFRTTLNKVNKKGGSSGAKFNREVAKRIDVSKVPKIKAKKQLKLDIKDFRPANIKLTQRILENLFFTNKNQFNRLVKQINDKTDFQVIKRTGKGKTLNVDIGKATPNISFTLKKKAADKRKKAKVERKKAEAKKKEEVRVINVENLERLTSKQGSALSKSKKGQIQIRKAINKSVDDLKQEVVKVRSKTIKKRSQLVSRKKRVEKRLKQKGLKKSDRNKLIRERNSIKKQLDATVKELAKVKVKINRLKTRLNNLKKKKISNKLLAPAISSLAKLNKAVASLEKSLIDEIQKPLPAQPQKPATAQPTVQKPKQAQPTLTKAKSAQKLKTTPKKRRPLPKLAKPARKVSKITIRKFKDLPTDNKKRSGYIIRIKEGNRIVSQTIDLLPQKRARNLMRNILDKSLRASGETVRVGVTNIVDVKNLKISEKFRPKKSKDPKVRREVEKRKFRLDSRGEKSEAKRKSRAKPRKAKPKLTKKKK